VVSLVPLSKADVFLEKVKRSYPLYQGLSEEDLDEAAFATLPGSGAGGEFSASHSRQRANDDIVYLVGDEIGE